MKPYISKNQHIEQVIIFPALFISQTLAKQHLLNCNPCLHSQTSNQHANHWKWHSNAYQSGLEAKWGGCSAADVWLTMLLCRSSSPAPANRCGRIQMREWSPQGARLNHMVSDQYSAVYFTWVQTLAHHSLEHAHLTSFKSCFIEICGGLFTFIANSTFDFADMLRGCSWCGAQGVNDSPHLSVLQQRLESKQVEWRAKFSIF